MFCLTAKIAELFRKDRREELHCFYKLFTTLCIPFFNFDTLKLINSPNFTPLNFK